MMAILGQGRGRALEIVTGGIPRRIPLKPDPERKVYVVQLT